MRLFTRSLVAAILTAGGYLSIPTMNVLAQAPSPSPSISARGLSDQKLKAVATALERVSGLRDEYQQRIAETEAPAEKRAYRSGGQQRAYEGCDRTGSLG